MTLKTLNDLIVGNINPDISAARADLIKEIKEAAREWLLDLREAIKDSTGDSHIERWEWEAQIEWIEPFFNLEDEDE